MTIRDLFDAGGPHAPESAKAWGEAISDAVDAGTSEAVAATPDTLALRDAAGRTKVADGVDPADAVNKGQLDAAGGGGGAGSSWERISTVNVSSGVTSLSFTESAGNWSDFSRLRITPVRLGFETTGTTPATIDWYLRVNGLSTDYRWQWTQQSGPNAFVSSEGGAGTTEIRLGAVGRDANCGAIVVERLPDLGGRTAVAWNIQANNTRQSGTDYFRVGTQVLGIGRRSAGVTVTEIELFAATEMQFRVGSILVLEGFRV